MSISQKIEDELFEEKSLLAVYLKSRSYAANRLDQVIRCIAGTTFAAMAIYLWLSKSDLFGIAVKSVSSWTSLGFSYSTQILGFLVAGFTIFSTMTRTEIFIALSHANHDTLGVSQLKFIFLSFLRVFISHIFLIFMCVAITLLKDTSGIYLGSLVDGGLAIFIKKIGVTIFMPTLGYLIISTLLHLKTFLWNLYQSIVIAIAGSATLYELDQQQAARSKSSGSNP